MQHNSSHMLIAGAKYKQRVHDVNQSEPSALLHQSSALSWLADGRADRRRNASQRSTFHPRRNLKHRRHSTTPCPTVQHATPLSPLLNSTVDSRPPLLLSRARQPSGPPSSSPTPLLSSLRALLLKLVIQPVSPLSQPRSLQSNPSFVPFNLGILLRVAPKSLTTSNGPCAHPPISPPSFTKKQGRVVLSHSPACSRDQPIHPIGPPPLANTICSYRNAMAAELPTFPRLVFTILEPLSL